MKRGFGSPTGEVLLVLTTQYDSSSNTQANVTQLTTTVSPGGVYLFDALLFLAADVTRGFLARMGGSATATSYRAYAEWTESDLYTQETIQLTSLSSSISQDALSVPDFIVKMTGTITVNAGGTFGVRFANAISGVGTSSILVGSSLKIRQKLN
jgi:hypothetical protein